jgi:hypothetical protein
MNPPSDDPPFVLTHPINALWTLRDIAAHFHVDLATAEAWKRWHYLPKTWRRGRHSGLAFYAPEQVIDKLANHGIFPKGDASSSSSSS